MRTLKRSKAVAAIAAGLLVAGGGIAAADGVVSDGDGVAAPTSNQDWSVGTVCTSSTASRNIPVVVTRSGNASTNVNNNVFQNGATVTIGRVASGLTVEAGPKNVTLPSTWQSSHQGQSDAVFFNVAYTAPATAGTFSGTVTFTASGQNNAGVTFTRSDELTVSGTAEVCDSTPPNITPNVVGTAGLAGWYTSDVDLTWTVTDAQSAISSRSGCDDVSITSDQAGTTYTCSATSAGGSNSQSITLKRDANAPTVSYTSASGTAGNGIWYTSPVVATFTGTDTMSGPASATQTVTSIGEGSAVTVSSPAFTDVAGNQRAAGAASQSFSIDLNDPTASFVGGPADGATYPWGSVPAAPTCTSTDTAAGSGQAGCTVSGYSSAVGSHTLTATATDNAGRTGTATSTYTVDPWTVSNFFQPVDMGATNTAKSGSTIPVKFEITSGGTELTSLTAVSTIKHQSVSCLSLEAGKDEIEQLSTSTAGLKYDPTNGGQYIYTWKSPSAGCYRLTVTAADGSTQFAFFQLRR